MKQFFAGTVFGLCCSFAVTAASATIDSDTAKSLDLFVDAVERIQHNYVRPIAVSEIVDKALHGLLSNLDPHSSYLNPEEFQTATGPDRSAGIGLELTISRGVPEVVAPIEGAPADKAGIRSGDLIASIDGHSTDHMTLDAVIKALHGDLGSSITLSLLRAGRPPFDLMMTRAMVSADAVRHERIGDVGYIRLPSFNDQTEHELAAAITALRSASGPKLKGYVLDLRNNPGGLFDQSVAVSDDFLDRGRIVALQGRTPENQTTYDAQPGDLTAGLPIVVLINHGSAAGSEIVAAALMDNRRATLIGEHSFGQGTIQTIIPVGKSGSYMRLTTATFVRPSGDAIDGRGIEPDTAIVRKNENGGDPQLAAAVAQLQAAPR
jgi:carboxyl-terminal processing protease